MAFSPVGRRGSWFADWQGHSYPCVHTRWRTGKGKLLYDDPGVQIGVPKWDQYINAIQELKKAIETSDNVPDDPENGTWRRRGYIGLWMVDDVHVVPNDEVAGRSHLRFSLVKRLF